MLYLLPLKRLLCGVALLLFISLLFAVPFTLAQNAEATAEPSDVPTEVSPLPLPDESEGSDPSETPSATLAPVPTVPALPTDPLPIPTLVETATLPLPTTIPPVETAIPTMVPTSELITEEATPVEETDEPIETVLPPELLTPSPTVLPTFVPPSPESPLTLLLTERFDSGDLSQWRLGAGWVLVAHEEGQALQLAAPLGAAQYVRTDLANVVIKARFLVDGGSAQLLARQSSSGAYSATLFSDGRVELARSGQVLTTSAVPPSEAGQWRVLRLSVLDDFLHVAVDDVEVLTFVDPEPLASGALSFAGLLAADREATVQVDDVSIWYAGDELPPAPDSQPTQSPPNVPTVMPTIGVLPTLEVTLETLPVEARQATETPLEVSALAVPRLSRPADNAVITNLRPTLRWRRIATATQYRIEVATDAAFTRPTMLTAVVQQPSFRLPSNLAQGQYWWRVSARNAAGRWSRPSPARRFTINLLRAPAANAILLTTTTDAPTFRWFATTGVTGFKVEIATNQDFSNIVYTSPRLSGAATEYSLPAAHALGHSIYYWRLNIIGLPAVSPVVWRFTVSPPLPAAPTYPSTGGTPFETTDSTPDLIWDAVTYSFGPITYEVQVDDNVTFTSPEFSTGTMGTTQTVTPPLAEGGYNWRVRAVNGLGVAGPWSEARRLTLQASPPDTPSSTTLIQEALVRGDIDYVTSLRYRIYALLGDPRLPSEFESTVLSEADWSLFADIAAVQDQLTPEQLDEFRPFLVRPTHEDSIFNVVTEGVAAPANASTDTAPGCKPGWTCLTSAHYPVKVWIQGTLGQEFLEAAVVMNLLTSHWDAMTALMGNPLPDTPNPIHDGNDDDRIDIYVVPNTFMITRPEAEPLGDAHGAAVGAAPKVGRKTSGYILIDRALLSNEAGLEGLLVHEFFHLLGFAHNATVFRDGPTCPAYWIAEASAVWAETHFINDPLIRASRVHVPLFNRRFQAHTGPRSLHRLDVSRDAYYDAYIWLYFMQLEHNRSPQPIGDLWQALEAAATCTQALDIIDTQFPFQTNFYKFALRNLNRNFSGTNPIAPLYDTLNPEFDVGVVPQSVHEPTANLTTLPQDPWIPFDIAVPSLAAQYLYFVVPEDSPIRQVSFDFSALSGNSSLGIHAVVKINGEWKPVRSYSSQGIVRFCFTDPQGMPQERLEEIYLVFSNHNKDRNSSPVTGQLQVKAQSDPCTCDLYRVAGNQWTGTITFSYQDHLRAYDSSGRLAEEYEITLNGTVSPDLDNWFETVNEDPFFGVLERNYASNLTGSGTRSSKWTEYTYTPTGVEQTVSTVTADGTTRQSVPWPRPYEGHPPNGGFSHFHLSIGLYNCSYSLLVNPWLPGEWSQVRPWDSDANSNAYISSTYGSGRSAPYSLPDDGTLVGSQQLPISTCRSASGGALAQIAQHYAGSFPIILDPFYADNNWCSSTVTMTWNLRLIPPPAP